MKTGTLTRWTFSLLSIVGPALGTAAPLHAADQPAPATIGLFDGQAKGWIAARFVPNNEKKGTLTLSNRTRTPLTIELPSTMGAVPVLAQIQPAPQRLGLTLMDAGNGVFRQAALANAPAPRSVQLAPRAEVRLALKGVCLQYGNPTPNVAMRYQLVPIEQVTADARIAAALQSMADGNASQPAVQAVAWNLANGKSWKSLKAKFSSRDYQEALRLLKDVSEPPPQAATPAYKST